MSGTRHSFDRNGHAATAVLPFSLTPSRALPGGARCVCDGQYGNLAPQILQAAD